MSTEDILVDILVGINLFIGFLLILGKVKLVIQYRDEDEPSTWPEKEEEDLVDNYVKPMEMAKPPMIVEAPKRRRGRPRKSRVQEE